MSRPEPKPFQPVRFLASMATGGLSTAPFLLGRSLEPGSTAANLAFGASLLFAALHYGLSVATVFQGRHWLIGDGIESFRRDLTKAPQILMPLGSAAMSINVWVGPVREILPQVQAQVGLWMPALTIAWLGLATTAILWTAGLLASLYSQPAEIRKLGFVWLFPTLAMGLVSVSGAALAESSPYAWAAHLTGIGAAISALSGLFMLLVLLPTVVQNQLGSDSLPPQGGAYSIMNLAPTTALYGIAFFHWTGYAHSWLGLDLSALGRLVVLATWAFMTGYILFGFRLLRGVVQSDISERRYVGNQWALSCSPIAWSVVTSLLQFALFPSAAWTWMAGIAFLSTLPVVALLATRMSRCVGWISKGSVSCA